MYDSQNDSHGEVKRDEVLHATLAYWRTAAPLLTIVDPPEWEVGSTVQVKVSPWVWLVLAIIIALTLSVIILL